jgi:hypothetical protein
VALKGDYKYIALFNVLIAYFVCLITDDYFDSRMPIVMKRIAQGGVRLAMILNRVFGDSNEGFAVPT